MDANPAFIRPTGLQHPRQDVVDAAEERERDEAVEEEQIPSRTGPGEAGQFADARKHQHDADESVKEEAGGGGVDEFEYDILPPGAGVAGVGEVPVPSVAENWHKQAERGRARNRRHPARDRCADEGGQSAPGREEAEGPEGERRELAAEQRASGELGEKVKDDRQPDGREPEAEEVSDIPRVDDGLHRATHGIDHEQTIAHGVNPGEPEQRGEQIPLRREEVALPAHGEGGDGAQTDQQVGDEQHARGVARHFQQFKSSRGSGEDGDDADGHADVPEFPSDDDRPLKSQAHAAQPAEQPEQHTDASLRGEAIDERVHRCRTHATEREPGAVGKHVGRMKLNGGEQTEQRCKDQPERTAGEQEQQGPAARRIDLSRAVARADQGGVTRRDRRLNRGGRGFAHRGGAAYS